MAELRLGLAAAIERTRLKQIKVHVAELLTDLEAVMPNVLDSL